MSKPAPRSALRIVVLLTASAALLLITWFCVAMFRDGLSAKMMTFESEPIEGWNYWRWFFIKRSMPGSLIGVGTIAALWVWLGYGWVRIAMAARHLGKHSGNKTHVTTSTDSPRNP